MNPVGSRPVADNYRRFAYHHEIGAFESVDPQDLKVLEWVGRNRRVLEIGCHTGSLCYWLSEQGCAVTGIDFNEKALEIAERYCAQTILLDLNDSLELSRALEGQQYDYVIALHVLEHLYDPWVALGELASAASADGKVILALPNISNAVNRIAALRGEFEYEETGVMDVTHIRFFNYDTLHDLVEEAGLRIDRYFAPSIVRPAKEIARIFPKYTRTLTRMLLEKLGRFSKNWTDRVMLVECSKVNSDSGQEQTTEGGNA